jgi:hypothetical protein
MSGSVILIVLVDSEFTLPEFGKKVIAKVEKYYPSLGIMLLSIEKNGFRAYSFFESHRILALMQLENLTFKALDLAASPPEAEPPF